MNPLAIVGSALLAVTMLIGAYAFGRADGQHIEQGKQAATERAVRAEAELRTTKLVAGETAAQTAETQRQQSVREVYRETSTITERPVYRNVCVDPDGLRALDRAAAIANGEDTGKPVGGTTEAPKPAAQP